MSTMHYHFAHISAQGRPLPHKLHWGPEKKMTISGCFGSWNWILRPCLILFWHSLSRSLLIHSRPKHILCRSVCWFDLFPEFSLFWPWKNKNQKSREVIFCTEIFSNTKRDKRTSFFMSEKGFAFSWCLLCDISLKDTLLNEESGINFNSSFFSHHVENFLFFYVQ